MPTITITRLMEHPVEHLWPLLEDFGGIHRWSAGIKSSFITPGSPVKGIGSERTCQFYDGHFILERVTQVIKQRRLALEVFETSMPLRSAEVVFGLTPTHDDGTDFTLTFDYVVKYGLLGKAAEGQILRQTMKDNLTRLLAALDEYARTGIPIPEGWKPT